MKLNHLLVLTFLILHSTFSWDRNKYFRNPKTLTNNLLTPSRVKNIPQVPFRNRGKEHSGSSSSWSFERSSISRQAGTRGRFDSEQVVNGIPYGKSGYARSATLYDIEITETGVSFLNIMTNGGGGDVDIYVKRDDYPTKSNYDVKSAHPGNQEQIIIENPVQGR